MNKNRIIKIISSVTLIASLVIALPILGTESNHKGETLESLEANILSGNLEIKRAKDNLMIAEYKEDEAEENKGTGSTSSENAKSTKYYPVEAEMNVKYAEWDLAETKQEKVLEGVQLYYDYKYLQDEINLQQNRIDRLEAILKQVNTKIDLGTATINDRTTADLNIQKAAYDMQVLVNDRDRIFLDLNVLLGYGLDTQLVFEYKALEVDEYFTESITEDVEYVLENNGDLIKLGYQGSLASIDLQIYKDYSSSGDNDRTETSKKETVTNLSADYKDKKQSLEYDVRSKYNSLLNSYDSFIIKELELENLQLTLDVTTKRFNVGLDTKSSVDLAQENLDFAQLAYEQAKLDYYVSVESYTNFID